MAADMPTQTVQPGNEQRALWRVSRGQALRLPAMRVSRLLRLREGQLWVTADGRLGAAPPEDWWLAPGETLRVPAGARLLASGWPCASFELLEEPDPA